jgi:MFS family permease
MPYTGTRLFTGPFLLVSAANFASGMAFALFLHFSGYLADLGASDTQIGLIYGATAVASIAMRPLLGTVMDRHGRVPVIMVGNVLNIAFVLLYLTVSTLGPWVYVVRIGHGVAEAMLFSALFTYGADVVPASRRTEGIALFGVSGLLPIAPPRGSPSSRWHCLCPFPRSAPSWNRASPREGSGKSSRNGTFSPSGG